MPTGKIVPEVKELQHKPTVVYFKRKILKKKKENSTIQKKITNYLLGRTHNILDINIL